MYSLFKVRFPWFPYFIILLVFWGTVPELKVLAFMSVAIVLHQFILLFNSIGQVLPIRYLFGLLMSIQMLLGPVLAYYGLDEYQPTASKMKITELEYFTYVLPAVCFFIVGLHFFARKLEGEVLNERGISNFLANTGNLPVIFIIVGFSSNYFKGFFGAELGFVFYLMSSFRYIGLFMLVLSKEKVKTIWFVLVFGSLLYTAIQRAMFHDLIVWAVMLGSVLAIKYKPKTEFKALITTIFLIILVVIQQIKGEYRKVAWTEDGGSFDKIESVVSDKQEKNTLFDKTSLARSNVRINQGYIITNIMSNVPAKIPYANGEELYEILEAAFLPRVLAPTKLNAGDRLFFMKWSGMAIAPGTSMGLSSVGDGYINFGPWGGCLFMLALGLAYGLFLNGFHKSSKKYPALLLFTPLVFSYPIRPDCELQTAFGHLIKSTFFIYVIFQVIKYKFFVSRPRRLVPGKIVAP